MTDNVTPQVSSQGSGDTGSQSSLQDQGSLNPQSSLTAQSEHAQTEIFSQIEEKQLSAETMPSTAESVQQTQAAAASKTEPTAITPEDNTMQNNQSATQPETATSTSINSAPQQSAPESTSVPNPPSAPVDSVPVENAPIPNPPINSAPEQNSLVENTPVQEVPTQMPLAPSLQNVPADTTPTYTNASMSTPETSSTSKQSPPLPEFMKQAPHQPAVNAEEKLWAFIGYIPLLGIIAMIMKPESQFVRLHGKQGLAISLFFFFDIFFYLIPFIQYFAVLIHFAALILIAFSMYQALIGNWWKTPLLGDIADLIPVNAIVKVSREAVMGEKAQEQNDQNQPPSSSTPLQ